MPPRQSTASGPPDGEAERFATSLKAVGVYAEVAGDIVRLNRDSLFGLLATTNAAPTGVESEDDAHFGDPSFPHCLHLF